MGVNLIRVVVHWLVRLTQLIDPNSKTPVSIKINVVQNSILAAVMIRLWPDASWDFKPHLQVSLVHLGFLSVIAEKLSTKQRHNTVVSIMTQSSHLRWNFQQPHKTRSHFQPIYRHTSTLRKCISALHECTEHTFSISAAVFQYLLPLVTSI